MASKILLIFSLVAVAYGAGNAQERARSHYDWVQAHHAQVNAQIQAQARAIAQQNAQAFGYWNAQPQANARAQRTDDEAKNTDDDSYEQAAPPGYKRMYVPPLPPPPPLWPGFGTPLPIPQPPPLYAPDLSQGFQHFQNQPFNFPSVNIPTPGEIKNIKPERGQIFNGVSVKSVSGFTKDKDGNTVRTGGTTVVINDNGDVKETKVGKNPPNIEEPIVVPLPHQFEMPKMPEPVKFKPFVFKPIEPIVIKPVDMNYVPADGENFVAVSTSSHSESSNINGVKTSSGGSNNMLNVNGAVDQEAVEFRQGDDPEKNDHVVAEE